MDNNSSEKLIQKRPGVITISPAGIAFAILCAYLAIISLQYVTWIPEKMVSLLLYGFVAVSALAVCVHKKILFVGHTKWCAAMVLVFGVSCLYAYNAKVAGQETVEMIKVMLFSVMFLNVVKNEKQQKLCMAISSAAPVLLFLYLLITNQLDVEGRLGNDLTGNANTFATLFMVGAMCSVYFVFFTRGKIGRIFAIVALILQLYAIALAGSRKFFLVPIALLAGVKLMSTDKNGRKHILRNVLVTVILVWVVWWMLFNVEFLYDSIGYRMEGMINAITGKGEADRSSQIRMSMIERALELWKKKPLFGWGIDNFKVISGFRMYAHNNFVELLCDVGLFGTLIYYSFYGYSIVKLYKAKNAGTQRWYWIIALLCLLVFDYGAVSYDMYNIHIMLLLASVALHSDSKIQQQPAQKEQ